MIESYRPPYEIQPEEEPSLPTDPTEAAAWLKEIWEGGGGWKSQHPLKLKVKGPEDYQKLSEGEKEKFKELGSEFLWIAEMYRSEMAWSQSYVRTNQGEIIAFRFGSIDEEADDSKGSTPNAYVYRPFGKEGQEVFLSQGDGVWKMESLQKVIADYEKYL